jgi:hypothetical protein
VNKVGDLTREELKTMIEEIVESILDERVQELVDLEVALQRLADKEDPILFSEDFRREVLLED